MKRILTASLHHESNTFNPIITGEDDFSIQYGEEVFEVLNLKDSVSGVIRTLKEAGFQVIPTVCARAVPNGEISKALYQNLKNQILTRARTAKKEGPIDALCLSLHGSMRIEEIGEAEGDLLEALRQIFPTQPIFAALDMHTTFTKRMFDSAQAYVGYKCAPHTDCYETGAHAARICIDTLNKQKKPSSAWVRLPFLVAGEKSETTTEPMKTLIRALREEEKDERVLVANYLMGFPWADGPDSSAAVVVTTHNDPQLAKDIACKLGSLFWSYRESFQFHTETHSPQIALDRAFEEVKNGNIPVYLSDSGDNPTAGSSGDCTNFLKLIQKDRRATTLNHPLLYGGIYDPEATLFCKDKVGHKIELTLGAQFDKKTTSPLKVKGIVKDYKSNWGTYNCDMALFSFEGIDLVLLEKHIGYISPEMFRALEVEPKDCEIVVCKLGYLTAPQREVAKVSIMALTEGSSNEDLESLPYSQIPRPIYPLDKQMTFIPEQEVICS